MLNIKRRNFKKTAQKFLELLKFTVPSYHQPLVHCGSDIKVILDELECLLEDLIQAFLLNTISWDSQKRTVVHNLVSHTL